MRVEDLYSLNPIFTSDYGKGGPVSPWNILGQLGNGTFTKADLQGDAKTVAKNLADRLGGARAVWDGEPSLRFEHITLPCEKSFVQEACHARVREGPRREHPGTGTRCRERPVRSVAGHPALPVGHGVPLPQPLMNCLGPVVGQNWPSAVFAPWLLLLSRVPFPRSRACFGPPVWQRQRPRKARQAE